MKLAVNPRMIALKLKLFVTSICVPVYGKLPTVSLFKTGFWPVLLKVTVTVGPCGVLLSGVIGSTGVTGTSFFV